ncbi:hypothetical protein EB796_013279 [Bugula neritina]|uniref:O-acyltransferase WSD1 C-terminal domain-containing protein n=1 Tax=Bugula neritina TaxID=10212 RepID=A0A7J7JPW9_BUGNE|nr:hypothetical protein EB796_013279 [Bugula neritina]
MLLGMTFTDLLLSMTVGATKDVLKPCPKVMVPFDLWSNLKSSTPLPRGNFLMMVPCPVSSTAEVIPRLWLTEHLLTTLKKSGDTKTQFYMLSWLHCLPFSLRLCRFLHRYLQGQCSALVTSFDGPKTVDYIEGASIRDIMFFTYPPHHVQYSLNFISYSGTIKLSALSTSELPSDVIESIVSNMSQQLSQINRKVFQRYFPDGLNKSSCPYRQPQASKVFNEFMNKMMEIDALSPSTADSNGAGGESFRTHSDSSADRPLTSNNDPPGDSNDPPGDSNDPLGDSNEPHGNPRNSCPALSPNMSHNNHSVCHGSHVTEDGGNFQQDVDGLLKLPPTSSLSVSLLHHEKSPFASFKANTSKSKSMSALAEAAISERQLLHDGKDVYRRNVSHSCMYSISEDVATASITPTDAISFEVPSDTDINSLS